MAGAVLGTCRTRDGKPPRRVVGSTDVLFAEDDGSHGRFTGIFDALTPATLTPPER